MALKLNHNRNAVWCVMNFIQNKQTNYSAIINLKINIIDYTVLVIGGPPQIQHTEHSKHNFL